MSAIGPWRTWALAVNTSFSNSKRTSSFSRPAPSKSANFNHFEFVLGGADEAARFHKSVRYRLGMPPNGIRPSCQKETPHRFVVVSFSQCPPRCEISKPISDRHERAELRGRSRF